MALAALTAAVFSGLSPRMRGRFGFKTGANTSLGGEFVNPFAEATPAGPDETPGPGSAPPPQELPPRTGCDED